MSARDAAALPAVILAGGLGTRLGTLTADIPKPLVPVCGRPFLDWLLSWLAKTGVAEVILLIGYLGEKTRAFVGDGRQWGLAVRYSVEPTPLGTGGALKHASNSLPDRFLLLYGDSYLPIDYADVSRTFNASDADAMMVLYADRSGSTAVNANATIDAGGCVREFRKGDASGMTHIDAGAVALNRSVLSRLPDGSSSLETELYPVLAAEGRLMAYRTDQRFYDMGTPAGLAEIERLLSR